MAAEFVERHAKPRQRTWRETERRLRVYVLPVWGERPIPAIARRDAVALLDRIVGNNGPVMANRVLGTLRKMFSWSAARGLVDVSPIVGVEPPGREQSRARVLTDEELARVWLAAGWLGHPWAELIHLLILTGQRRAEVAGMRWAKLGLNRTLWTIPGARAKNGRTHLVHLSPPA